MRYVRNSVVALVGLLIMLVSPVHTSAQKDVKVTNSPSEPVPVTGTVNVGNTVQFRPAIPPGAFSIFTETGNVSGPDPAGTSYAITSLTVADVGFGSAAVIVRGVWGDTSDCSSISNSTVTIGPLVKVPAGGTIHLSFPQPFILSAKPGATSCLRVEGPVGIDYTVVGYKF